VENDYRIPPGFLNIIRNWKKAWFEERLLPALMEPVARPDPARDNRLKFLEALAANHVAPNSAAMAFQRSCEVAASKSDHPELPQGASFEELCSTLPRVLATAAPATVAPALEQLCNQMGAELEADGSQASIACLTESLLELLVASLLEGGSIAGVWHVYLARVIQRTSAIHERLWSRMLELCRDHAATLSSHQVYGIASLLVAMATLSEDGQRPHLCFTGFYANLGAICCAPSDVIPGPLLAGEVLRASVLSLMLQGQLALALRLACSYVVCALRLGPHVTCNQPEPDEPSLAPHDTRQQKQQGQDASTSAPPAVSDLVVWVPKEAVNFLVWAVRHAGLREGVLMEMKGSGGNGPADLTPFLEVAKALMSSSAGAQLADSTGNLPLETFLWLEVAAASSGLSPATLTDISVRHYLWKSSWNGHQLSPWICQEDGNRGPLTSEDESSLQSGLCSSLFAILQDRLMREGGPGSLPQPGIASAVCLVGGALQDFVAARNGTKLCVEGGPALAWTAQAVLNMVKSAEACDEPEWEPSAVKSLVRQVAVQLLLRQRAVLSNCGGREDDVHSWCGALRQLLSTKSAEDLQVSLASFLSCMSSGGGGSTPSSPMQI